MENWNIIRHYVFPNSSPCGSFCGTQNFLRIPTSGYLANFFPSFSICFSGCSHIKLLNQLIRQWCVAASTIHEGVRIALSSLMIKLTQACLGIVHVSMHKAPNKKLFNDCLIQLLNESENNYVVHFSPICLKWSIFWDWDDDCEESTILRPEDLYLSL